MKITASQKKKIIRTLLLVLLLLIIAFVQAKISENSEYEAVGNPGEELSLVEVTEQAPSPVANTPQTALITYGTFSLDDIDDYGGNPYFEVNNNKPFFTDEEIDEASESFEYYSPLDNLGRCGVCVASIGLDLMPDEVRGNISSVKPTGWVSNGKGYAYYNRCHLIGYQLTGENANKQNLITGTRYLNVIGMLPFEDLVDDYIEDTGNHVLYRVTPVFVGDELVARGVLMEGYSIEDSGEGVSYNVFCYNVQNGLVIDYMTGQYEIIDEELATSVK